MTVKVFRINREKIIDGLRAWAKNLTRDDNVLAVALFGSLAKNEETPASDSDILILLKESNERFDNRIPRFIPCGIGIGMDVFPYTLKEFRSSLARNWGIEREVMKCGILLSGKDALDAFIPFYQWFCKLDELGTKFKREIKNIMSNHKEEVL